MSLFEFESRPSDVIQKLPVLSTSSVAWTRLTSASPLSGRLTSMDFEPRPMAIRCFETGTTVCLTPSRHIFDGVEFLLPRPHARHLGFGLLAVAFVEVEDGECHRAGFGRCGARKSPSCARLGRVPDGLDAELALVERAVHAQSTAKCLVASCVAPAISRARSERDVGQPPLASPRRFSPCQSRSSSFERETMHSGRDVGRPAGPGEHLALITFSISRARP